MKIRTAHLPAWLGAAAGLFAGYLLAQGAMRKDALADRIPTRSRQQSRQGIPSDDGSPDPSSKSKTQEDARRFLLKKDKLAKLRNSHRSLRFELTSFRTESAANTDSIFELLRELLNFTPDEEKNLRALFMASAGELVDYEKAHSKLTTTEYRKLVLELSPLGDKGDALADQIRKGTRDILGEERAAILDALSHPESIVRSRPNRVSPVQMEFTQTGSTSEAAVFIKVEGGNREMIMGVGAGKPEQGQIERMRDMVFEGYEHLIDESARTTFIRQALPQE